MIRIRRADKRGERSTGGVSSCYSFSFGAYQDEAWTPPGPIKALNEEVMAPGARIEAHSHRNVEILTYILEGEIRQRDATGEEVRLTPGKITLLRAGSGVRHTEFNPSGADPARFLQLWVQPRTAGEAPYTQTKGLEALPEGSLTLIASGGGEAGALALDQDLTVFLLRGKREGGAFLRKIFGRRIWVQVSKGEAKIGRHALRSGDGAEVAGVGELRLDWSQSTELLLIEMPV